MTDSSITAKDASGSTITLDTQDVGGTGQHQQAVVLGDGANAGRVAAVDSGGAVSVRERTATTATLATVTATTGSTTIRSSNAARRGLIVHNDSTNGTLYLALDGSTATTNNYSIKLYPEDRYEMWPVVTTTVTGIWSAASGSARVTELS